MHDVLTHVHQPVIPVPALIIRSICRQQVGVWPKTSSGAPLPLATLLHDWHNASINHLPYLHKRKHYKNVTENYTCVPVSICTGAGIQSFIHATGNSTPSIAPGATLPPASGTTPPTAASVALTAESTTATFSTTAPPSAVVATADGCDGAVAVAGAGAGATAVAAAASVAVASDASIRGARRGPFPIPVQMAMRGRAPTPSPLGTGNPVGGGDAAAVAVLTS